MDTQKIGGKTRPRLRPLYIIITALILGVILSAVFFIKAYSVPVSVEVGGEPDYSHITSNEFVSLLCRLDADTSEIDTSKPAETAVPLRFFGFVKAESPLYIVDTKEPEIVSRNVFVTVGTEVTSDMFVSEVNDKTQVTFDVTDEIDTASPCDKEITLSATDEGGNCAEFTSRLTVIDPEDDFSFEYGITAASLDEKIKAVVPETETLDIPQTVDCGEHLIEGENSDTAFFLQINIADTRVPMADVRSFDVVLGDEVSADEIVKKVSDRSEVTTEFLTQADFSVSGVNSVEICFTDAYGNSNEYVSHIYVHDIECDVTAELGSTNDDIAELIFNDEWSRSELSFNNDFDASGLGIGTHETSLRGRYSSIPVAINIVDTTSPVLTLQPMSYLLGSTPSPEDFVTYCSDYSEVSYSFKSLPDENSEGTFETVIVATDSSGNSTEAVTEVTFYRDTEPPVISGYGDITVTVGDTCDFTYGVTAYDDVWGTVDVHAQASSVSLQRAGEYPLVYTASDGSGNTARVSVIVTVKEPLRVCLDVQNIMQKPALPNGCEVVSLAIALNYAGYSVDPVWLYDEYMPKAEYRTGDPWVSYIGNAKGLGLGCYAPCVAATGNAYLASVGSDKKVTDVSGREMAYYERQIDNGTPVIVWGTVGMRQSSAVCWRNTVDGRTVDWHTYSHCLVLIGYTDDTYIFCDPLRGVVEYGKTVFEKCFEINYKQACIVK